jgi:O-antigen/teichoic acid export membrane protein
MNVFFVRLFSNINTLSLTGSGSIAVFGFLNFAILARQLSQNEFGIWIFFIATCTLFELLRTGFLHTPLIKYLTGSDEKSGLPVLGSSWAFAWMITGGIMVISLISFVFFADLSSNPGLYMTLKWLWLVHLTSLPFNFATWYLQSQFKFGKILFVRLISQGGFCILLLLNYHFNYGLSYVLYSYLAISFITSLVTVLLGWTFISSITHASKEKMKELYHFGKYSMGTMIGSNLLRTSDIILIGFLLGTDSATSMVAVAMYSVPSRLFEIIEVPLRSLVATALPRLSKFYNSGDKEGLKCFFEKSVGELTILLIPLMLFCFIFAEPLVILLAGDKYAHAGSANILRIFTLYACLLPLDRFSGITLDVMNIPVRNFQKVMLMLGINLIGDVIALKLIGEVWAVAVGSILTFITGVIFGSLALQKILNFSIPGMLSSGYKGSKGYATTIMKTLSRT